jgi:hypothetical protein
MFGEDDRFDIASHAEISDHAHPARGEQGQQLVTALPCTTTSGALG